MELGIQYRREEKKNLEWESAFMYWGLKASGALVTAPLLPGFIRYV